MLHLCSELGLGKKNIDRLEKSQIFSVESLLGKVVQLKETGISEKKIEKLQIAVDWLKNHEKANVLDDFDSDIFDIWENEIKKKEKARNKYFDTYIYDFLGKSNLSQENRQMAKSMYEAIEKDEMKMKEMIERFTDEVMKSSYLKHKVSLI